MLVLLLSALLCNIDSVELSMVPIRIEPRTKCSLAWYGKVSVHGTAHPYYRASIDTLHLVRRWHQTKATEGEKNWPGAHISSEDDEASLPRTLSTATLVSLFHFNKYS